jgi:hypothetical protein
MYRKLSLIFILFLAGCVGGDDTLSTDDDFSITDIAAEFQDLRTVKGHFAGGDWNDDVDKWMGRKHQLMIQLGSRLGTGEYSKAQVVQWLAPPDLIARAGDDLFELVSSQPDFEKTEAGVHEFLVYHWRGTHDFLYFGVQDERVANSGWWYAGE